MLAEKIDRSTSIELHEGFPDLLAELADREEGDRSFLRPAWFGEAAGRGGHTLVARRCDGSLIAAFPTIDAGLPAAGVRAVPGCYWPFRSVLIDPSADESELAEVLAEADVRSALAPAWRLGPIYRDDPSVMRLTRAAARAGWTVLVRSLAHTFVFELGALVAAGEWPRRSTRRRLSGYARQLERSGEVSYRLVAGADWRDDVLDLLADMEARSWVGLETDGSGAKFLSADQRGYWRGVLRDPALAASLSATILTVGQVPAAFSFDLRAGDTQFAIAGSYAEEFAHARAGKLVTYHQLQQAAAAGVQRVDLGAGDSGYKRELGAVAGSEIIDLLIVRNRSVAQVLQLSWGGECEVGRTIHRASAGKGRSLKRPLLAAGALAAAAVAAAE